MVARFTDASETAVEIIEDGKTLSVPTDPENRHYAALIASGVPIDPFQPPAPSQEVYAAAIQAHIDATAKSKGYGDGVALASYISSTMPGWQAEAAAFIPWRDAVWVSAYTTLGAVQGGATPPSIEALIAGLPPITWPT